MELEPSVQFLLGRGEHPLVEVVPVRQEGVLGLVVDRVVRQVKNLRAVLDQLKADNVAEAAKGLAVKGAGQVVLNQVAANVAPEGVLNRLCQRLRSQLPAD